MLCSKCSGQMRVYKQDDGNIWFICPECEHEDMLREEKAETINFIYKMQQTHFNKINDAPVCSG